MDGNRNRPNHLAINKISKNIGKSPLRQPTYTNPKQQQQQGQQQQQRNSHGGGGNPQPQPKVYNINKSDFRSVVQQLTGTPTREDPSPSSHPPPAQNPPKPPSVRLHRIRPPPLEPIARPPRPINPSSHPNFYTRPAPSPPADAPAQSPTITFRGNTLESPISAFMRYLENSITSIECSRQAPPPQLQQLPQEEDHAQVTGSVASSTGLLPNQHLAAAPFPYPRGGGGVGASTLSVPGLLPSPTSPSILPSPSAFLNLMSPQSPFPPLSPRFRYPPVTPNQASSSTGEQSGSSEILGPAPQPPSSAGLSFPSSPSGFLPMTNPR